MSPEEILKEYWGARLKGPEPLLHRTYYENGLISSRIEGGVNQEIFAWPTCGISKEERIAGARYLNWLAETLSFECSVMTFLEGNLKLSQLEVEVLGLPYRLSVAARAANYPSIGSLVDSTRDSFQSAMASVYIDGLKIAVEIEAFLSKHGFTLSGGNH